MAFEVYHKTEQVEQVIFNWELLVTFRTLFIRSDVECTWIIVGGVENLQALHDKPRNNHKNWSWRGIP